MATQGNANNEGESSNNNNQQLDSTLARMAKFFDEQRIRWNGGGRAGAKVTNDLASERFQKFNSPKYDGEPSVEVAEKWIESIEKIYKALRYSDARKVAFAKFQLAGPTRDWWRVAKEKLQAEVRH